MNPIEKLRQDINLVDRKIVALLTQRAAMVRLIMGYKLRLNLPLRDMKREKEIVGKLIMQGKRRNLPAQFIQKVWKNVFEYSYSLSKKK